MNEQSRAQYPVTSVSSTGYCSISTHVFEITAQQIADFAQAIGAHNPIHFEVQAAASCGYSAQIAPVTFAVTIAQAAEMNHIESADSSFELSNVLHANEGFVFHRPLIAGDRVGARVVTERVMARPSMTSITTRTELIDLNEGTDPADIDPDDQGKAQRIIAEVSSTLVIRKGE